jgi:CheY-like chemotaxis protein
VANGAEAIRALETIPYDLVLMDVQMPELDGLEATRRIRSAESSVLNPGVPVIAMTAHAMQGDRERCLDAGMNDYLTKPIDPQALAGALETWLSQCSAGGGRCATETVTDILTVLKKDNVEVFDKASMMARLMNDADLAMTITEGFLSDIPIQIEKLRRHLEDEDADAAVRQAHTIKGASANVGGQILSEVALKMETAGKERDMNKMKMLLPALAWEFERLREAMHACEAPRYARNHSGA